MLVNSDVYGLYVVCLRTDSVVVVVLCVVGSGYLLLVVCWLIRLSFVS